MVLVQLAGAGLRERTLLLYFWDERDGDPGSIAAVYADLTLPVPDKPKA